MAPTLSPSLRRTVVVAVLAAALPLLMHMPSTVAMGVSAVALVAAFSALTRPLPAVVRVLLVMVITGAVLLGFGFRVGRDAGSALMLAMLVLKLSELREFADARRVVAFALFAPFAAFLQDQGPLTLVLGLLSASLVVMALARLARVPERALPLRSESFALLRALMLALPLALVGFWLFPRLSAPLWGLPENAVARTGVGESMSPGDWIDLLADDRPAFRVRFAGPTPSTDTLYWRGPVLTRFDGRTWTRNEWLSGLPAPSLPQGEGGVRYTITLEPTDRRYVFALESPVAWPATLELGPDASLRSKAPLRTVTQLSLRALQPEAFQPDLSDMLKRSHLNLPADFNPKTRERARSWRSEAGSDRAYIDRVLRWFNADLSYSLAAPPLGRHTADEFLFDTRIGFCEHFSSAFVILMRNAGIPARVVIGYVGGQRNPFGEYWVVRQMDAHAWSEVWLEGEGWVRVDPTAAVAPERIFDTIDDRLDTGVAGAFRPMFDFGDSLREAWNNFVVGYDAVRQIQLLDRLGWKDADSRSVGTAFVLAAGLMLALTLAVLLRPPPRERDPLLRAWRGFLRRWAKRGLEKRRAESAAQFLRRAALEAPSDADRLRKMSEAFGLARYADAGAEGDAALIAELRAYRPPKPLSQR